MTLTHKYKRRCFRLPVCPRVGFAVYEHPERTAWSPRFEPLSGRLNSDVDLSRAQPWVLTRVEVQWMSTAVRTLDGREHSILLRGTVANGKSCEARFDYGLLQSWKEGAPGNEGAVA